MTKGPLGRFTTNQQDVQRFFIKRPLPPWMANTQTITIHGFTFLRMTCLEKTKSFRIITAVGASVHTVLTLGIWTVL